MKKLTIAATLLVLVIAGCSDDDSTTAPIPFPAFTDDFEDGTIGGAIWDHGGQIAEQDGNLQLRRETPADFIETRQMYSGNWKITMTVRLNTIHWNDMFHGISLRDKDGAGISWGFSRYGKLFMARHDGKGGTSYTYGPDGSNNLGQWQTWTIEKSGAQVAVQVDGQPVVGISPGEIPNGIRIALPGIHEDGDGGGTTGMTSSDVDLISIEEGS